MVTDALLQPLINVVAYVVGLLPDGQPVALPPISGLWDWLRDFDSLIPVMGPVTFFLALVSAVVVFVAVRLTLTVWNLIYP